MRCSPKLTRAFYACVRASKPCRLVRYQVDAERPFRSPPGYCSFSQETGSPLSRAGLSHMTNPVRSSRHLPLHAATVLFPGAAQHVAHKGVTPVFAGYAEWCAADPGSFRARSVAYPDFREDMMWNDPGSAEHRFARAPRCTASGKSIKASTRTPPQGGGKRHQRLKQETSDAIALLSRGRTGGVVFRQLPHGLLRGLRHSRCTAAAFRNRGRPPAAAACVPCP